MSHSTFAINLGGEGEIPDILNQQRADAVKPGWFSVSGKTLAELIVAGHRFLICPNDAIALPDECVDVVYTNNVPVDTSHPWYGPGVQSSEIRRILKSGGVWIRDGVLYYTKP
jgi:hypothetical protein